VGIRWGLWLTRAFPADARGIKGNTARKMLEGRLWMLKQSLSISPNLRAVLFVSFALMVGNARAADPVLERSWHHEYSTPQDDWSYGVAMNQQGAVYVSGWTNGPDPLGATAFGGTDGFLAKINADGSQAWKSQFGTPQGDKAYDVAIAADGGVYVAGITGGSLFEATPIGADDAFVTKYSTDGQRVWTRQFGSHRNDNVWGLTTDSDDNIYVVGQREQSDNTWDAYVTKLSPSGSELWSWESGMERSDYGFDVSVDSLGNVFMGGAAYPGPGYSDIYITKLSENGTVQWEKVIDVHEQDRANEVEADGLGNVYVKGQTHGSKGFLWKLDGTGDELWGYEADDASEWGLWANEDSVALIGVGGGIVQGYLRVNVKVYGSDGSYLYGGMTLEGGDQDFLRIFPKALAQDDEYGFAVAGFGDPSGPGGYDIFVERYGFIPEPATLALLGLGGLALLRSRRAA
jgi:hypothetical protein